MKEEVPITINRVGRTQAKGHTLVNKAFEKSKQVANLSYIVSY